MAPLTLIFGGSLIAATHVGIRGFVIDDLVRDVAVFCSFLAVLDVLRRSRPAMLRWVLGAAMVAVTVLTVTLILDNSLRARATYVNPNIPAHLLACAVVLFAVIPRSRWVRVVMVSVGLIGLYRTGSFGATLQLLVAGSYLLFTWVCTQTRTRERLRVAFFGTVIVLALSAAFGINSYLNRPGAKQESGLSAARLDRSGSTRFKVWEDAIDNFTAHPLGTGPGSSRDLSLLALATETHNEPLSYLSERGIIGFAGLALLWVTVWRFTRRGGLARALFCGYLAASLFRETMHYRHWWLFLPLAMVFDEQRAGPPRHHRAPEPTSSSGPDHERAADAGDHWRACSRRRARSAATPCPASPGRAWAMAPRRSGRSWSSRCWPATCPPTTSVSSAPRSSSSASASSSRSPSSALPSCSDPSSSGAIA